MARLFALGGAAGLAARLLCASRRRRGPEVPQQCLASAPQKAGLPRSMSSCSTGLGSGEGEARDEGSRSDSRSATESEGEAVRSDGQADLELDPESPSLWAGAHRIGKPEGCEDAFFVTPFALGVADGVGSMARFARLGVDAAAFAAELMEHAERALAEAAATRRSGASVADIMDAAGAVAAAERQMTSYGASTITVLQLRDNKVNVANLGDSGFILLRGAPDELRIEARTTGQQHDWNFPYQLERFPPILALQIPAGHKQDTAADCDCLEVETMPGDLLLLYTDGFSDNIYDDEVLKVIQASLKEAGPMADPARIAQDLARAAYRRSMDEEGTVPFGEAAKDQGYAHHGGKPDDITVAAAWVLPPANPRQKVLD